MTVKALQYWWTRSRSEHEIMRLLENDEWWTGIDLVKNSRGKLNKGTVYAHLYTLETEGRIVSVDDPDQDPRIGITRRRYRRVTK